MADETAEKGSPEYFGDTATQTASVLASIEKKLASIDLDMGDAVKMQTYLVAPEGSDGMDFQGSMEGYTQYLGTEDQPELQRGRSSPSQDWRTLLGWLKLKLWQSALS